MIFIRILKVVQSSKFHKEVHFKLFVLNLPIFPLSVFMTTSFKRYFKMKIKRCNSIG